MRLCAGALGRDGPRFKSCLWHVGLGPWAKYKLSSSAFHLPNTHQVLGTVLEKCHLYPQFSFMSLGKVAFLSTLYKKEVEADRLEVACPRSQG